MKKLYYIPPVSEMLELGQEGTLCTSGEEVTVEVTDLITGYTWDTIEL